MKTILSCCWSPGSAARPRFQLRFAPRIGWASVALGLAAVLTGCIPSLNALYTEKDLIHDPALLGTWAETAQTDESWTFRQGPDKSYSVIITNKGKLAAEFSGHLMKLGDLRFLDLTPSREAFETIDRDDFYKAHFIPIHTFYLVRSLTPTLQLSSLDPDWLKAHLTTNSTAVAHTLVGPPDASDRQFVLTASTPELQRFVQKAALIEGAFAKPGEMLKLSK